MKKQLLVLLTAAAMIMTGCDSGNSSQEGDGGEGSQQSSGSQGEVNVGWSDAAKELINTYIYGVDVPYLELEGNEDLFFDEENYCLSMTGAIVTAAGSVVEQYAALFDAAEGWEGGLYDEDEYPGLYSYEKAVTTSEGTRYVTADIYALDDNDDYATVGTFWLDLYDWNYYSWDEMGLEDIYEAFGVTEGIPAFPAEFYQVDGSWIYFGYLDIYAYNVEQEAYNSYMTELAKTWTSGSDEDGDYFVNSEATLYLYPQYVAESKLAYLSLYFDGEVIDIGGDDDEDLDPSVNLEAEGTITLTAADMPTSYDDEPTPYLMGGIILDCQRVMNQSNKIQIKKGGNYIGNSLELAPIASISVTGASYAPTVKAGTSASSLSAVTAEGQDGSFTFNLNGAKFFELSSGSSVLTMTSLVITFQE